MAARETVFSGQSATTNLAIAFGPSGCVCVDYRNPKLLSGANFSHDFQRLVADLQEHGLDDWSDLEERIRPRSRERSRDRRRKADHVPDRVGVNGEPGDIPNATTVGPPEPPRRRERSPSGSRSTSSGYVRIRTPSKEKPTASGPVSDRVISNLSFGSREGEHGIVYREGKDWFLGGNVFENLPGLCSWLVPGLELDEPIRHAKLGAINAESVRIFLGPDRSFFAFDATTGKFCYNTQDRELLRLLCLTHSYTTRDRTTDQQFTRLYDALIPHSFSFGPHDMWCWISETGFTTSTSFKRTFPGVVHFLEAAEHARYLKKVSFTMSPDSQPGLTIPYFALTVGDRLCASAIPTNAIAAVSRSMVRWESISAWRSAKVAQERVSSASVGRPSSANSIQDLIYADSQRSADERQERMRKSLAAANLQYAELSSKVLEAARRITGDTGTNYVDEEIIIIRRDAPSRQQQESIEGINSFIATVTRLCDGYVVPVDDTLRDDDLRRRICKVWPGNVSSVEDEQEAQASLMAVGGDKKAPLDQSTATATGGERDPDAPYLPKFTPYQDLDSANRKVQSLEQGVASLLKKIKKIRNELNPVEETLGLEGRLDTLDQAVDIAGSIREIKDCVDKATPPTQPQPPWDQNTTFKDKIQLLVESHNSRAATLKELTEAKDKEDKLIDMILKVNFSIEGVLSDLPESTPQEGAFKAKIRKDLNDALAWARPPPDDDGSDDGARSSRPGAAFNPPRPKGVVIDDDDGDDGGDNPAADAGDLRGPI